MAVAFVASVGMASAALPEEVPLYADQNITVGTVNVSWNHDGTAINITYNTTDSGWVLNATHLHVDNDSADEIPQTKKKNPIPGHFDYSAVHVSPHNTVYTYSIPAAELSGTVFIAAHAKVALLEEEVWQEESAWAGTEVGKIQFNKGKNWATYFTVTVEVVDG